MAFADDLRNIVGVSPNSVRGQEVLDVAVRRFEEFMTRLAAEFENETSLLSQQLASANVDRDFLRDQLAAINSFTREGQRTGRRHWFISGVFALGSLFGSVAGGIAEGIASELVADAGAPKREEPGAGLEQLRLCSDMMVASISEGSGGEIEPPTLPPNGRVRRSAELRSDLDVLLNEMDAVLATNPEDFVKSYVQKGGE
ncbi:MAG TPA: ubiquitin-like protein Pup [Ilumatobacteraceae bacterium]|nr:ubiquitin-like protein Pup [Ilumatobacteraceae bacterium]